MLSAGRTVRLGNCAQAGGELVRIPAAIVDGAEAQWQQVTRGADGALAWPALLRKLDRIDPGFRN